MSARSGSSARIFIAAMFLIITASVAAAMAAAVADPIYTLVGTLAASDKSHDVVKAPSHLAVETSSGVVVVADTLHHRVVTVAPNGSVAVLAGSGLPGLADGSVRARSSMRHAASSWTTREAAFTLPTRATTLFVS